MSRRCNGLSTCVCTAQPHARFFSPPRPSPLAALNVSPLRLTRRNTVPPTNREHEIYRSLVLVLIPHGHKATEWIGCPWRIILKTLVGQSESTADVRCDRVTGAEWHSSRDRAPILAGGPLYMLHVNVPWHASHITRSHVHSYGFDFQGLPLPFAETCFWERGFQ
jgi:hypothetical protein